MIEYLVHLATIIAIYAILGVSLNLVVGYTGLPSLVHAAFCGIGAYATAILLSQAGMNFFLSIIVGVFITGIVSLLIGMVLSKFRGDYYALGSFGFNVIVFSVFLNWQDITGGALGIPGIAKPEVFGIDFSGIYSFLALAIFILAIIFAISRLIVNSAFGRVLKAIREDEEAIQVFGYNTLYYKLAVFVISAAMAGVAGALFASYYTFIDPTSFELMQSIFVLAIIILGGLASLRGAIVGSLFLILLPEALRFVGFPTDMASQLQQLAYGAILVILMLYRPQGLVGEYKL